MISANADSDGRMRRKVLGMLLAATTINYIDRQTLSVLAPLLESEIGLNNLEYSYVVNSFLVVYSVMYLLAGGLVDRLGTRRGLGFAIVWWSAAEMLHGAAIGFKTLCLARALLAIGEAAIIPSGVKAVSEWFAPRERGVAVGTFEIGLSLGPILAPPLVSFIALHWGWRHAFFWTGVLGLLWAVPWFLLYRTPKEMHSFKPDATEPPDAARWISLLTSRRIWAIGIARFFGDPIWYFYLFWMPKYLSESKGLSLAAIGAFAWIPYVGSLFGGLAGGVLSGRLIARGWDPVRARKQVLLGSSIAASAGVLSIYIDKLGWALVVISIASFALQCWGVNLDTLSSDILPSEQVAGAVGMCGLLGAAGGILFTAATGFVVQNYSYTPIWVASALAYPVGLSILWRLLPHGRSTRRDDDTGKVHTIRSIA